MMRVIKPLAFVKATHLIDSNAGETVALWNSGTTYTLGQTARYADRVWESVKDSPANLNKVPTSEPTYWLDVGPSNTLAMFDAQNSTVTTGASPLTVILAAPNINALAFVAMTGVTTVTVTGRDGIGGAVVYSATATMSDDSITGWYQWFFSPRAAERSLIIDGMPPRPTMVLTVSLEGAASISVGTLLFGSTVDIGQTLANPKVGILDYSRKTTDEYGVTTFVARAYSRRVSAQVMIGNQNVANAFRCIADLRATPSVWVFDDRPRFGSLLTVYGFFRDFSVDIAYPDYSTCSIEIEGLT